jgi:hypothetical protein
MAHCEYEKANVVRHRQGTLADDMLLWGHNPTDLQEANRCSACQRRLPHLWRTTLPAQGHIRPGQPSPPGHTCGGQWGTGSKSWPYACAAHVDGTSRLRASFPARELPCGGPQPDQVLAQYGRRPPAPLTGMCRARGTAGKDAEIG